MKPARLQALLGLIAVASIVAPSSAGATSYAYITNSGDDTVSVIDTSARKVIATIPVGREPRGVAVAPDGRRVYVANRGDSTLSVIDATKSSVIGTVHLGSPRFSQPVAAQLGGEPTTTPTPEPGPGDEPLAVAVGATGSPVYVSTFGGPLVAVVDAAALEVVSTVAIPAELEHRGGGLDLLADGSKLYAAATSSLIPIDTVSERIDNVVPSGSSGGVDVVVNSLRGRAYLANGNNGSVIIFDLSSEQRASSIDGLGPLYALALSPDGGDLIAVGGAAIHFIDVAAETLRTTILSGDALVGVAFHPSQREAYVTDFRRESVYVIDIVSESVAGTIPVGTRPVAFGKFVGPEVDFTPTTPTPTITETPTVSGTPTETPPSTDTPTATPTPSPSSTPSPSGTTNPTSTPTLLPSATPSLTPPPSSSPTRTASPTGVPTPSATSTPSASPIPAGDSDGCATGPRGNGAVGWLALAAACALVRPRTVRARRSAGS